MADRAKAVGEFAERREIDITNADLDRTQRTGIADRKGRIRAHLPVLARRLLTFLVQPGGPEAGGVGQIDAANDEGGSIEVEVHSADTANNPIERLC